MKLQHCSNQPEQTKRGFTRADLCAVLMAITVLAFIALPALGTLKPRSDRVTCLNNLRQLGVGWNSWAKDNGNKPPWYVLQADGGTKSNGAPFVHFAVLSNYVADPRIMVCPFDQVKKPAGDYSDDPNRGLLSTNFQNNGVGYFIGCETAFDEPRSMMAGDRNLSGYTTGNNAYVGFVTAKLLPNGRWTKDSHNPEAGNVLYGDGSVTTASGPTLIKAFTFNPIDSNAFGDALIP